MNMKLSVTVIILLTSVFIQSSIIHCETFNTDPFNSLQDSNTFSHTMAKGWGNIDQGFSSSTASETTSSETNMTLLKKVLENNRKWVEEKKVSDSTFFQKHKSSQSPPYLWIGCSDSRVPPNEILGLGYGELFVMRNVANIVSPSDIGSVAVVQYTVQVLKVTDIIVGGHYGCGGVKASLTKFDHGPLQAWLSQIRRLRLRHSEELSKAKDSKEEVKKLVELNVREQVMNVATKPFVQKAWKKGQQLRIHGVIYDLQTGKLLDQGVTMYKLDHIPEELRVV